MKTLYDGSTFEVNGVQFRVNFEHDSDRSPLDCDGHGPVRQSNYCHIDGKSDKKPGERPLNQAGRNEYQFYYDWTAACKAAKKDGWNCEPFDAPNRVERAVKADFDYLRGFYCNDWNYVGVIVSRLDDDGEETGEQTSLWGVETHKNYHCDVALEIAGELLGESESKAAEVEAHYLGM